MARPPNLSKLSVSDLNAELTRRRRRLPALQRRRSRAAKRLASIDAQIAELGGSVAESSRTVAKRGPGRPPKAAGRPVGRPPGRRRAKNKMSLVDTLSKVVSKEPMGIADIVDRVKKAGYKSSAKGFRSMVNIALIKNKQFKRAGRGKYAATG